MKRRSYVKITKLSASEDPVCQTPSEHEYQTLKDQAIISLPVDYWVEGYLLQEPEVDKPVVVEREIRNGIKVSGLFTTSLVVEVLEDGFKTLNSVYKLKYIRIPNE